MNIKKYLYIFLKAMVKKILNIYFKKITIIGLENIPENKPLMIPCNHNNQFIDAMLLIAYLKRPINFIMARTSVNEYPVVGFFMKFLYVLLVNRPQDKIKNGTGVIIEINQKKVKGKNTKFLKEIKKRDFIKPDGIEQFNVKNIVSDIELEIEENYNANFLENKKYKILPKPKQDEDLYKNIFDSFERREILGIFPEGSSHDKPIMLPFKAGVSNFIYLLKKNRNLDIKVVPCSINYLAAHKFRSNIFINFGKPVSYTFDKKKMDDPDYKRKMITFILKDIKEKIQNVKISAPSYNEVLNIFMLKNFFITDFILNDEQDFLLFLKLCKFYNLHKENKKLKKLIKNIDFYRKTLKSNFIKIKDIKLDTDLQRKSLLKIFFEFFFYFLILLPSLLLIHPIRIILYMLAEKERKKDQIGMYSYTKVLSTDVIASEKIFKSLFIIPVFIFIYSNICFLIIFSKSRNFILSFFLSFIFFFVFSFYSLFTNVYYDRLKNLFLLIILKIRLKFTNKQSIVNYLKDLIEMKYKYTMKFIDIYFESEINQDCDISSIFSKDQLKKDFFENKKSQLISEMNHHFE